MIATRLRAAVWVRLGPVDGARERGPHESTVLATLQAGRA